MSIAALIATIVVILILIAFFIGGLKKGFLKILLSIIALVAAALLAFVLAKPVATWLQEKTEVGTSIETGIEEKIESMTSGITLSLKSAQTEVINSLPLPESLKTSLDEHNTQENYTEVGASGFVEYISIKLTYIILFAGSLILLFIILNIIFRLIVSAMTKHHRHTLIGGINAFFGGVIGLVKGLILLGLVGILITALANTEFGLKAVSVIQESPVLQFFYDHNLITIAADLIIKK